PHALAIYSDSALRDLHSFPTRRSSDLAEVIRRTQRDEDALHNEQYKQQDAQNCADEAQFLADDGEDEVVGGFGQPEMFLAAVAEDRKSTRLNSSHVSISYAVFCLKKKR